MVKDDAIILDNWSWCGGIVGSGPDPVGAPRPPLWSPHCSVQPCPAAPHWRQWSSPKHTTPPWARRRAGRTSPLSLSGRRLLAPLSQPRGTLETSSSSLCVGGGSETSAFWQ